MKTQRCIGVQAEVCSTLPQKNPARIQLTPPIKIRHYAQLECGHLLAITDVTKDLIFHEAATGDFVKFDCEKCE